MPGDDPARPEAHKESLSTEGSGESGGEGTGVPPRQNEEERPGVGTGSEGCTRVEDGFGGGNAEDAPLPGSFASPSSDSLQNFFSEGAAFPSRDSHLRGPSFSVGADDLTPTFDPDYSLAFNRPMKGSMVRSDDLNPRFPQPPRHDSSESSEDPENPLARYDPILPGRRSKRRGNAPDPDHYRPQGPDGFL